MVVFLSCGAAVFAITQGCSGNVLYLWVVHTSHLGWVIGYPDLGFVTHSLREYL
jgi:hypothetical protein